MLYAFDTGGHRPICRYTVHEESCSSPTMRSLVTGGYTIMRHNEVRDLTALLGGVYVCGDVQIEPTLVPLSGEAKFCRSANVSPEARLDVSARSFFGDQFSRTMFDVRIFHPNALSVRMVPVASQYVQHEKANRGANMSSASETFEGASLVTLVLSTSRGMDRSAAVTFKRLSATLVEKVGLSYAATVNVVCCRLLFALLRSAIAALRGSRRRLPHANHFAARTRLICWSEAGLLKNSPHSFSSSFCSLSLSLSLSLFLSLLISHPFIIFVLLTISSPIKPVSNEASRLFSSFSSFAVKFVFESKCVGLRRSWKKDYTSVCVSILASLRCVRRVYLWRKWEENCM